MLTHCGDEQVREELLSGELVERQPSGRWTIHTRFVCGDSFSDPSKRIAPHGYVAWLDVEVKPSPAVMEVR